MRGINEDNQMLVSGLGDQLFDLAARRVSGDIASGIWRAFEDLNAACLGPSAEFEGLASRGNGQPTAVPVPSHLLDEEVFPVERLEVVAASNYAQVHGFRSFAVGESPSEQIIRGSGDSLLRVSCLSPPS